jgi:hypothetical protein
VRSQVSTKQNDSECNPSAFEYEQAEVVDGGVAIFGSIGSGNPGHAELRRWRHAAAVLVLDERGYARHVWRDGAQSGPRSSRGSGLVVIRSRASEKA